MARRYVIVSLLFIFFGINLCSPKKKSVNDPIWREESLKMASGICKKMTECIQESEAWKNENSIHAKLIKDRFQEAKCQDYHRKSNVYLLIGEEVETIKTTTISCYNKIMTMNCESIIKNALEQVEACILMEKIQKGNN
ncbi:MAG: hypothetical protein GW938_09515 [Leptospira sp.]|jgi:hypothetical protein|nr:hypothetical protein [Leptospira sp.]